MSGSYFLFCTILHYWPLLWLSFLPFFVLSFFVLYWFTLTSPPCSLSLFGCYVSCVSLAQHHLVDHTCLLALWLRACHLLIIYVNCVSVCPPHSPACRSLMTGDYLVSKHSTTLGWGIFGSIWIIISKGNIYGNPPLPFTMHSRATQVILSLLLTFLERCSILCSTTSWAENRMVNVDRRLRFYYSSILFYYCAQGSSVPVPF